MLKLVVLLSVFVAVNSHGPQLFGVGPPRGFLPPPLLLRGPVRPPLGFGASFGFGGGLLPIVPRFGARRFIGGFRGPRFGGYGSVIGYPRPGPILRAPFGGLPVPRYGGRPRVVTKVVRVGSGSSPYGYSGYGRGYRGYSGSGYRGYGSGGYGGYSSGSGGYGYGRGYSGYGGSSYYEGDVPDYIENRYERRLDRIDNQLDYRQDRLENMYETRYDQYSNAYDSRSDRLESALDYRQDRFENLYDFRQDRLESRFDTRQDRMESALDFRQDRMENQFERQSEFYDSRF